MRRSVVLGVLLGVGMAMVGARALTAQQNTAAIQNVRDNLYLLTGGGGNTAALVTDDGVVLVDTKLANWGPAIMSALKTVTDKPVTTIINTHTHGDHVGSNEFFPADVQVVVHENTRANMARMDALKDKPQAMPDRTYQDRLTLTTGGQSIELYHFGPAHTNGDTMVVFPQLRVLHTGDLFPGKSLPFMDSSNGGTGLRYPDTMEKAVSTLKGVERVIPGHSPVMAWSDLVEFSEFTRAFVTSVQASLKAGRTAEQAAAELKLPERFKGYSLPTTGNFATVASAVALIYKESGR